MLKTIGIMGGMGPAATVDLMSRIISMTDAVSDQEHIPMIVDSDTRIPDRTEAILGKGESPVPEMLASARRLEAAGADFIVIACHAAHYFVKDIKDRIGIPILEMPEETAKLLKLKEVNRAAVLGTDGTVQSGLFAHGLERMGIQTVYPDEKQQKSVMSLVYDYVKKGEAVIPGSMREDIMNLIGDLSRQGAEALILAKSAIRMAGAKVRETK